MKPSFAQQGEDMILDRIISRILKKKDAGVYVDVGAYHPFEHSVTYNLYLSGWAGIAVDASEKTADLFREHRPNDAFICAAVGAEDCESVDFFTPKGRQISLVSTKFPSDSGEYDISTVRQINLFNEMKRRGIENIDVLSLDVEGAELETLQTFDWSMLRPKVIAVEIHANSLETGLATDVARFLRKQGYRCVAASVITYFFLDYNNLFKGSGR